MEGGRGGGGRGGGGRGEGVRGGEAYVDGGERWREEVKGEENWREGRCGGRGRWREGEVEGGIGVGRGDVWAGELGEG